MIHISDHMMNQYKWSSHYGDIESPAEYTWLVDDSFGTLTPVSLLAFESGEYSFSEVL